MWVIWHRSRRVLVTHMIKQDLWTAEVKSPFFYCVSTINLYLDCVRHHSCSGGCWRESHTSWRCVEHNRAPRGADREAALAARIDISHGPCARQARKRGLLFFSSQTNQVPENWMIMPQCCNAATRVNCWYVVCVRGEDTSEILKQNSCCLQTKRCFYAFSRRKKTHIL